MNYKSTYFKVFTSPDNYSSGPQLYPPTLCAPELVIADRSTQLNTLAIFIDIDNLYVDKALLVLLLRACLHPQGSLCLK